jgi:hypothetical protein
MSKIIHPEDLNEFEMIRVMDHLKEQGVTDYTMRPGHNCIWVSYGLVDSYYIFNQGELIDIQFD